jgi:hypothetical protein
MVISLPLQGYFVWKESESMFPQLISSSFYRDTITRHFYQSFKAHFRDFCTSIQGISSETDRTRYGALLVNRLMFLCFLQQHGWLDGDNDYLMHQLNLTQQTQEEDTFYHHFLLPLCHHLSLPPTSTTSLACTGTIPRFGILPRFKLTLFAQHPLEHDASAILIPDRAFAHLIDFCMRYRWSLDHHACSTNNELSPAILAYVLEQQANQKQMGVYYTKDDVTDYIAQNTILPYILYHLQLYTSQTFACLYTIKKLLHTDPDRYIHSDIRSCEYLPTETERDYRLRRQRYEQLRRMLNAGDLQESDDLITHRLDLPRILQDSITNIENPSVLLTVYTCLEKMTILDPTCGCGAFLLAALDTLEPLYTACLDRIGTYMPRHDDTNVRTALLSLLERQASYANARHFVRDTILRNNLYGIDIMPEAIDVCKQLLLLSVLSTLEPCSSALSTFDLDTHMRVGNVLSETTCVYEAKELHNNHLEQRSQHEQDFDWFLEFGDVIKRGGFDVIIGNPPYIEYSKLRKSYEDQTQDSKVVGDSNLYATVLEQSLALCRPGQSYLGLIVPLSICSSERFAFLRHMLTRHTARLWLANFEIFPCRLFDEAYQRLTILLAHHSTSQPCSIFVTHLQRWYTAERSHLISTMHYTPVQDNIRPTIFPKLSTPQQETILRKLVTRAQGYNLAHILSSQPTPYFVYYQEATNYWMKATCRIPFYCKNGIVMEPPHSRLLFFAEENLAHAIMAVMNSSLFYLWFATYADGFHLSHTLVKDFPLGKDLLTQEALVLLAQQLEQDIASHARLSTRNTKPGKQQRQVGDAIELEEYFMAYSKPLLDQIDTVLARYYGLTEEELDVIVNYDVKYRVGSTSHRT